MNSLPIAPAALLALTLFLPAAADDNVRDLCPDRPGKATSACTLDEGTFQLESDIFNAAFQRLDGVTTDTWFITNPTLKYGVNDNFDVEANFSPLVILRTHDSHLGTTETLSGIGDLTLRGKWAIVGNGGSDFALVLEPFLKIPTAKTGLGNGALEGGLVAPLSLALGDGWSLGSTPELDVLKNNLDDGRHLNLADVVAISRNVAANLSLSAELWEATNFDPSGTSQAFSFDFAGAWQPDANTQLDAGLNLGLNRNIPGAQIYTGVSRRF